MSSSIEVAYKDLIRGLDGQATDLETIRTHVNLALGAGGVAAAFLANKSGSKTSLWVAFGAFALISLASAYLYKSVREFAYDFVDFNLTRFDDRPLETTLRSLLYEGLNGYRANRVLLNRHWRTHNFVLLLFAIEIVALLIHAA